MDPSDKQAAKYRSKNLMGYIQDKVDVGMTKLRSDEGVALDVAVLKATLQDEVVPKEKHVRTLKIACAGSAPRQQVNYVIHGLGKRLEEKSGWLVTLKTLIVFHRLMREVDPSFQEEMLRYQERTGSHRLLRLDAFADHTTKDTWDFSAWIRVYSVYLDERLGCFKSMRFDPEAEATAAAASSIPPGGGSGGAYGGATGAYGGATGAYGGATSPGDRGLADVVHATRLKDCGAQELLDKLPQVQRLLARLVACVPEGSAQNNEIVLQSCVYVLREARAVYRVVCEGVINLADKFFEMERADALKALDLYKENSVLNEKLNAFFAAINNVPALKGAVQFPSLQSLPADFLTTMEEYVRDAPKVLDASASGRKPASVVATGPPSAGATSSPQPLAAMRASTVVRQGGTTSSAISGSEGLPPVIPAPVQGVLKIGPPATAVAPQPSVDLLGDVFASATISGAQQQPQQAASTSASQQPAWGQMPAGAPQQPAQQQWGQPAVQQQQPFQQPQQVGAYGGQAGAAPTNPFGTPPAAAPYMGSPPPPQAPAAAPGFAGYPGQPQGAPGQAPPQPPPPQATNGWGESAFGSAPAAANNGGFAASPGVPYQGGFAAPNAAAAAAAAAAVAAGTAAAGFGAGAAPGQGGFNPFSSPTGAAPAGGPAPANPFAASNPFGSPPAPAHAGYAPAPGAQYSAAGAGAGGFGGPAGMPGGMAPHNPFGGVGPAWGQGPPPGASTWGVPKRTTQDPLVDLGVDLFGKPQQAPTPSLRDLKHQG